MVKKAILGLILSCLVFSVLANKEYLYDLNNSAVVNLNSKNFNNQITSNRAKNVISIVHYYKPDGMLILVI